MTEKPFAVTECELGSAALFIEEGEQEGCSISMGKTWGCGGTRVMTEKPFAVTECELGSAASFIEEEEQEGCSISMGKTWGSDSSSS